MERNHLILWIFDHLLRLEQSADVSGTSRSGRRTGVHKVVRSTSHALKQRLEFANHKAVHLCYNDVCDDDEPVEFHIRAVAPVEHDRKITLDHYRPKSRFANCLFSLHATAGLVFRKLTFCCRRRTPGPTVPRRSLGGQSHSDSGPEFGYGDRTEGRRRVLWGPNWMANSPGRYFASSGGLPRRCLRGTCLAY